MAFNKKLLDVIACPICKGKLLLADLTEQQELVCQFDKVAYPIKNNIPVLLESQARDLSLDELEKVKK